MKKKTHNYSFFWIAFFFLFVFSCIGQGLKKSLKPGIRLGVGSALSFYKINLNHAKSPTQKLSLLLSMKKEIKYDKLGKTCFSIGGEYFFHGLNFKSYYFEPNTIQLYDQTFPFNYSVIINEVGIPLQFKYSFKSETNSIISPYFMVGYHLRYLLPAAIKVTQNGTFVKDDRVDLKFKSPFIIHHLNSFVSTTLGIQKNSISGSKGNFFMELNVRYGLSSYSFNKEYAASSLYIKGTHVVFQVGVTF